MKFAVQRISVCLLLVLICFLGFNTYIRIKVASATSAALNSDVQIGRVRTSFKDTSLSLKELKIVPQNIAGTCDVEAESLLVNLDAKALMRRQFVITSGQCEGVSLTVQPRATGSLSSLFASKSPAARMRQFGGRWFENFADTVNNQPVDLSDVAGQVSRSCRMRQREIEQLIVRVDKIQQRVRQAGSLAHDPRVNPLRDLVIYERNVGETQSIQTEIDNVRQQIDRVADSQFLENDAVSSIVRRQLQRLDQYYSMPEMDAATLNDYLLASEIDSQVENLVRWIRWGTQVLRTPQRSQTVAGIAVDSLTMHGVCNTEEHLFPFDASISGLGSRSLGHPAKITINASGDVPLRIAVELGRATESSHERIHITSKSLPQPAWQMGNHDQLLLVNSPGNVEFSASLEIKDRRLSGDVFLRHGSAELASQLVEKYGDENLAGELKNAVADLHAFEIKVDVSGSLRRPDWNIKSDLGEQLASRFNRAFQRYLDDRRQAVASQIHRISDERESQYRSELVKTQQDLLRRLDTTEKEIATVRNRLAERFRFRTELR